MSFNHKHNHMIDWIKVLYRKNGKTENSNDMAERVAVSKFLALKTEKHDKNLKHDSYIFPYSDRWNTFSAISDIAGEE